MKQVTEMEQVTPPTPKCPNCKHYLEELHFTISGELGYKCPNCHAVYRPNKTLCGKKEALK